MGACIGKSSSNSKLPATMLAVEGPKAGPITSMRVERRPVPSLSRSQAAPDVRIPSVIVKVEYAALNPIDWKMMEHGLLIEQWPYAFGCDISGEIVQVPEDSKFKPGDKVLLYMMTFRAHYGVKCFEGSCLWTFNPSA